MVEDRDQRHRSSQQRPQQPQQTQRRSPQYQPQRDAGRVIERAASDYSSRSSRQSQFDQQRRSQQQPRRDQQRQRSSQDRSQHQQQQRRRSAQRPSRAQQRPQSHSSHNPSRSQHTQNGQQHPRSTRSQRAPRSHASSTLQPISPYADLMMPQSLRGGSALQAAVGRFEPRTLVAAAVVVLLAIFLVTRVVSCATHHDSASATSTGQAATALVGKVSGTAFSSISETFSLDSVDFAAVADAESPAMFTFATSSETGEAAEAPTLFAKSEASIKAALDSFAQDDASVGFIALNCETGKGVAYNIDEVFYGASSYKALYAAYVCQELVEGGIYSLGFPISSWQQTSSGFYQSGSETIRDAINDSIVWSDNASFGSLRTAFDGSEYDAWLSRLGVSEGVEETDEGGWFPSYSARAAAQLWLSVYRYLETNTETAAWLGSLLEETETSFLRDALEDAGYEGAVVRSKAGWCADPNPDYNSVCEGGVVSYEGADYLICVMTNAADSNAARANYEALATAVFEACR